MSPSASRYFRSALQVEPKRIARLEDTELGELMGQLLRAQSYRCGAPVSELLTNTQEKAADGGADAFSGKPATPDEWLGDAKTCWQLKAGDAGEPAKVKKEIVKPLPHDTLTKGGRFVLVASGSTSGKQGELLRLNTLTEEAKAIGLPTDRIVVIGSERLAEWVNQHPAIAAHWANRPEGLWSLQDWPVQEHQAPWQASDPLASALATYRQALDPTTVQPDEACLHLHLHGPPGAGKTRLALELCKEAPWADFVVYVQQARESNVLSLLVGAASEEGVRFVVVADDTPADLLKPLRDALEPSEGRIRLITLGSSHSPDPRRIRELAVDPLSTDSLSELLGCWYPAMAAELVPLAVNLAAGNPRLARLAADALHQNPALTTATLHEQPAIRDLRAAIASHQKLKGRSDWSWLQHWDFTIYRSEKRQGFVGRQWLFEEVRAWATNPDSEQALLIGADYGVGKSAFLAELVDTDAAGVPLAAHYFCTSEQASTLTPAFFVRSLATQLAEALPAYREHLETDEAKTLHDWLDAADKDPARALEQAVLAPLASLHPAPQPHLLVVDALDEAQEPVLEDKKTGPLTIVALLSRYAKRLPPWLKLLASSRRRPDLLTNLRKAFSLREIDAEETRNLDDLRSYAVTRCECSPLLEQLASADLNPVEVADFLSSKHQSSGKFLYVALVLNELASGLLPITERADLEALPSDLGEFYRDAFQRRFPTDNTYQTVAPILAVVAEAQEPLCRRDLAGILQCSEPVISEALRPLHDLLRLRQVTIEVYGMARKEVHHSFDHLSLKQWLSESDDWGYSRAGRFSINCQEGSEKIHTWALAEVEAKRAHTSPYLVRHLASHLRDDERVEVIAGQLRQFPWLQARLHLVGLNALLADFDPPTDQPGSLPPELQRLGRALRQAAHVLSRQEGWNGEEQLASQLLARLVDDGPLESLREQAEEWIQKAGGATPQTDSLLTQESLLRTWPVESEVLSLVCLPDGQLACGCGDGIIRFWDPASGISSVVFQVHTRRVNVLLALGHGRIATGSSYDGNIRLWNLDNGACTEFFKWRTRVDTMVMLRDGRIASGSAHDKVIHLWDPNNDTSGTVLEGHEGGVNSLAVLSDGRLASGSSDQTIRLWDTANSTCSAVLEVQGRGVVGVNALVALENGNLVSASSYETIRIWDPVNLSCIKVINGHQGLVKGLAALGDRRLAVYGSSDGSIHLYNLTNGTSSVVFQGHQNWVNTMAFTGDGHLVSGSSDCSIRVWDHEIEDNRVVPDANKDSIMSLAVIPDSHIAVGSRDHTIGIWDARTGKRNAVFNSQRGPVLSLAWLGNGHLASGFFDGTLCDFWISAYGLATSSFQGHQDTVRSLVVFSDGRLASGSNDQTIRLWSQKYNRMNTFEGHEGWVNALVVLSNGHFASGSNDRTIRLWDPVRSACAAIFHGHEFAVNALAVLSNGLLASGSLDCTIRLWNPASGFCSAVYRHGGPVNALAALGDGRLASGSFDQTIRLWDPRHPDGAPRVLFVADAPITALAWVPTHQLLVAGDASGRLHWLEMGSQQR